MPQLPQNTIFQRHEQYKFGPGVLFINTSSGFIPAGYSGATGTGTALGKCGPIEITETNTYVEATSIQSGTEADDAAVGGMKVTVGVPLKQAGIDVLEACVDGFSVERDTDNNPVQYGKVNVIGKMKRENSFQMTYASIIAGIQQWTDKFEVVDFFVTCPMAEETVTTVNAEGFREYAVMFRVFESTTQLDYLDRPAYYLSRAQTGV